MRKFLSYILIFVILAGIFGPTKNILAQDAAYPGGTASSSITTVGAPGTSGTPTIPDTNDCGLFSNWDMCILKGLTRISFILMGIMALLLWLAGTLLDFVLNFTIVDMRLHIKDLTGINIAWKLIRDLMNISFIFLLVYEGIKIIINQGDLGKVKKWISMVILASLLINFSLFFTKVLIDASNIVTIGFYNSMIDSSVAGNAQNTDTAKKSGLSVAFMSMLGASDFYSMDTFGNLSQMQQAAGGNSNLLMIGLLGSLVFLIISFVFLAVACLFVVRYVTLVILLMLSPVAYMGMALPFMKKYSDDWWNSLNGQLLFAPLYMIMTSIILVLMSSPGFITKTGNWSNLITNGSGTATAAIGSNTSVDILFNFVVVIGLIIASLVIAKSTSTQGSKFIGQATGKVTAFAGGAVMGGASRFGRNTFGRGGNAISNSEYLKDKASKGGVTGFFAKTALKGGTKAATSSFDVRSVGKFQDFAKTSQIDFGKGVDAKKVNFQKTLEEKAKAEADFAKTLKPTDDAMRMKEIRQEELKEKQEAAKSSLESSERKIKDLKEKEKKLRERVNKAKTFEEREEIKKQIDSTEELIKTEEGGLDALKKANEEASKAATSHEKEMKAIFTDRVNTYAKTFENESRMWRYTKNAFKIPLSNVSSITPTTAGDNREIARKVKGVLKEKKKISKESLKEVFGVDVDEKKEDAPAKEAKEESEKKPEETKTT